MTDPIARTLQESVVDQGICSGCGACVAVDLSGSARMVRTDEGPVPDLASARLPDYALRSCPGLGIDMPKLYEEHYGGLPKDWLLGRYHAVRTGHSGDPDIRKNSSSGGVITTVLLHLLRTEKIDGAIVVRQGVPTPEEASAVIATTEEELLECAQSVYIPVSTLDALKEIEPKKTYAMTCLPDQAAALRRLQIEGFAPANQVAYVLGPYTGTAMYPAAIRSFLRSHRVSEGDEITSLKWRAGEWPGYLEIETASGRLVRAKKFYYNYLIPFFITRWSLLGMDFANEFCDLSVGDAWSPAFEDKGGGHSVIVTRSEAMESLVREMSAAGELVVESIDPLQASGMHGHMIDFKKRGSYLRGRWRKRFGKGAPDFGLRPRQLPMLRRAVEAVIVVIFFLGRTRLARKIIELIPESVVGPIFNRLRLSWKGMSKPAKRKGLGHLEMDIR